MFGELGCAANAFSFFLGKCFVFGCKMHFQVVVSEKCCFRMPTAFSGGRLRKFLFLDGKCIIRLVFEKSLGFGCKMHVQVVV